MENFQDAVAAIAQALPIWEQKSLNEAQTELNGVQKSLNEAQTCQSVILRLLDAAGYDIWSPFEVFPEKNGGKDIPDFTIFFEEKARFIIEAKFLGKALNGEIRQATRYALILRLRWVLLTNGKQWIFLDNDKEKSAVGVALVLNLLEPREGEFLGILLNRELWKTEDADKRVAEKVQLIRIAMKVSKILSDTEITSYDQGVVKLVIEHALLSEDEDKDVAKKNLPQIIELLLPQNPPLVETPAAPITQVTPQTEALLNVWQVLPTNLKKLESSSSSCKYTLMFGEHTINFATLPDIIVAVAETCLTCKTEQSLVFVPETTKYSKRLLSNHRYISVSKSFDSAVNKVVKKQLESLGLPKGCITISSNKTSYTVP